MKLISPGYTLQESSLNIINVSLLICLRTLSPKRRQKTRKEKLPQMARKKLKKSQKRSGNG